MFGEHRLVRWPELMRICVLRFSSWTCPLLLVCVPAAVQCGHRRESLQRLPGSPLHISGLWRRHSGPGLRRSVQTRHSWRSLLQRLCPAASPSCSDYWRRKTQVVLTKTVFSFCSVSIVYKRTKNYLPQHRPDQHQELRKDHPDQGGLVSRKLVTRSILILITGSGIV